MSANRTYLPFLICLLTAFVSNASNAQNQPIHCQSLTEVSQKISELFAHEPKFTVLDFKVAASVSGSHSVVAKVARSKLVESLLSVRKDPCLDTNAPAKIQASIDLVKKKIRGRYLQVLTYRVQVTGGNGQASEFQVEQFQAKDLAAGLQICADIPATKRNSEANKLAFELAQNPQKPKIEGTQELIAGNGNYRISLLKVSVANQVVSILKPYTLQTRENRPFLSVGRNDLYSVKFTNSSPKEVALRVVVDGVDSFAFSQDTRKYKYYFVPPKSSATIVGWHKEGNSFRAFQVVGKGEGIRSLVHSDGKMGVIHLQVADCSTEPSRLRSVAETAQGPIIEKSVIPSERYVAPPKTFVSIRYDIPKK